MSDHQKPPARARQRFEPPPDDAWRAWPSKVYRFAALSVSKARADNLTQQAAALAFITMVSLVPLLAALSFLGAQWFDEKQERTVEILSQILPYSEQTILAQLRDFVKQAQSIRGLGFAAFILTSLAAFTSIERTINRIWNVPRQRSLRSRLLSFTMVLFWGPLVIGAAYSLLFYLRQRPAFQTLADSLPVQLIPFLVTVVGLTMLYWLVPYTRVDFRSALAGGVSAALLLEALRQGFGIYVEQVRNISLVYGGFGLLLFFMLSIQFAWWIVLLGSEVAYSLQNAAYMSSRRRPSAPLEGSWVALAAMVKIAERFRAGKPMTPHELLAERLQLVAAELGDILAPLLEAGLLCESSGEAEGYLLACDPHDLEVTRILELYESAHWRVVQPFGPELSAPLEDLRSRFVAERARHIEGVTLAQLTGAADTSSSSEPVEDSV